MSRSNCEFLWCIDFLERCSIGEAAAGRRPAVRKHADRHSGSHPLRGRQVQDRNHSIQLPARHAT